MARPPRNLPLWLRLLLRRLRSPEGRLAPLAVVSIAISVTLATGLEMSSRSARRQLEITAEAITGAAKIEITAGEVGLAEEILEIARATPGVRAASPLVSIRLRLTDRDFALNVLGVDLLAEEQVRSTAIEHGGLEIRDPLRLLATPNSVVATEALLERLGLAELYHAGASTELHVRIAGEERSLVVHGLLRPSGIAAAFSGQVALMDVYAAQQLGGRVGLFDRIDVVPEREEEVPELVRALGAKLAGVATVQLSSGRGSTAEDLLQMVRRSSLLLAGAAALVACLLTYATTAQWIERQKRQLATLRAAGMEARRVRRMVFVEVTALAVLGTALGIGGGIAVSPPLLATLSRFLQVAKVEELSGVTVEVPTLWLAVAVGLLAGMAGGVLPAYRASRRYTLDSLDLDVASRDGRGLGPWLGGAALVAFALVFAMDSAREATGAMVRVGLLFLLGAAAILALAPVILRVTRTSLRPLARAWPPVGHLATRLYRLRPWTFAVALTAISTLVAALVTAFLLIATISSAFDRWVEAQYPGGAIRILATPVTAPRTADLLSDRTMQRIRTTPSVRAVNEQYRSNASVVFRGETVFLHAVSAGVLGTHGHIPSVGRPSSEIALDLVRGAIAISPGFQKTFGLEPGDLVELDTRNGTRAFTVAGVFEDFGDARGSILIDLSTFDACWQRSGASSAVVWLEGPTETAIAEIRAQVGSEQDLYFVDGDETASATRRFSEVFTSTLHVLGAFIASLGGIGVMILLAGIVAERRRDLAVLRAAGAEPRQLVVLVLIDALTLGLLGSACGVALGIACAAPAADILRESYGWILEQRWMAPQIPFVVAGAIAAAVAGGMLPARMAYGVGAGDVFGPE